MTEKKIKLNGKDVLMRYCSASETGFEQIAGKSSDVFSFHREGEELKAPTATLDDYIKLAIASIVAAYRRKNEEPPINAEYIMFDASATEINDMITTVIALRNEWYKVPEIAVGNTEEESDAPKNA